MSDITATKKELLAILGELFSNGLVTSTGGNISFREHEKDGQIWIMPSGVHKGNISGDMLVGIDLDGNVLTHSQFEPSSEKFVHCEIYRAREDIHAVIHAHAPQSSILSLSGVPFLPVSTGAVIVGEVPRVPFVLPGTAELGRAVARALGSSRVAVMMQNHGLVVAASSLRKAADIALIIERTAFEILGCLAMGRLPPLLDPEEIALIRKWRHFHL
ncbi:MAG: class II aldolase/adducin family protein [Chloroflexi bacterium]|nr:class II aldolase/adducin family protein [Chloroflexota bacterium]